MNRIKQPQGVEMAIPIELVPGFTVEDAIRLGAKKGDLVKVEREGNEYRVWINGKRVIDNLRELEG